MIFVNYGTSMQFEWDEAKRAENIVKHRIDFADILQMFDRPMLSDLDERTDYGEERWLGIGFLGNIIAVVIWTERQSDTIRIISARRANKYERQRFEQYLSN